MDPPTYKLAYKINNQIDLKPVIRNIIQKADCLIELPRRMLLLPRPGCCVLGNYSGANN